MSATLVASLFVPAFVQRGLAQEKSPRYKADPPVSILTPSKVESRLLGEFDFFDGMPSKTTVEKSHDVLDVSSGVEAFPGGMPAASLVAALEGFKSAGMEPGDMGITVLPRPIASRWA